MQWRTIVVHQPQHVLKKYGINIYEDDSFLYHSASSPVLQNLHIHPHLLQQNTERTFLQNKWIHDERSLLLPGDHCYWPSWILAFVVLCQWPVAHPRRKENTASHLGCFLLQLKLLCQRDEDQQWSGCGRSRKKLLSLTDMQSRRIGKEGRLSTARERIELIIKGWASIYKYTTKLKNAMPRFGCCGSGDLMEMVWERGSIRKGWCWQTATRWESWDDEDADKGLGRHERTAFGSLSKRWQLQLLAYRITLKWGVRWKKKPIK